MNSIGHSFHSYSFENRMSGKYLTLELVSENLMPPSFSTRLLVENMDIAPGESVLDLGAGTGVIGIAAAKLGASSVTMLDIADKADEIWRTNVSRNFADARMFDYVVGDLYAPLGRRRFDHILANPPSTPSPDDTLPLPYCGGPDGRLFHDAIQFLAPYYLSAQGRLTIVHGSVSNVDRSLANLAALGFSCEVTGSAEMPFMDHYPLDYIKLLAEKNHSHFFWRDGKPYESRYVITARIGAEYHSSVMRLLDAAQIQYRMLPHKRIAKTVPLAAAERHVPVEEMVKCILLKDKRGKFVLACLTGDADLDVQRVREYVADCERLSFASPEEIKAVTGHDLGSVAPFSLNEAIPVVIDSSIGKNEKLNISSGDPRLGLELSKDDLLGCLGSRAGIGSIRKSLAT
jgi:release factor glutamine methyltransferase